MGDFLEIGEMAVEEGGSDGEEVGVAGIVNLDNTPGVLAGTDGSAADLDNILRSDDSEWHEASKFGVLLDGVLVVLLNIVGEVIDGDSVVLDILHDKLLGLGKLVWGERVGAADNGDNVDTGGKALHQLNIELTEAINPHS